MREFVRFLFGEKGRFQRVSYIYSLMEVFMEMVHFGVSFSCSPEDVWHNPRHWAYGTRRIGLLRKTQGLLGVLARYVLPLLLVFRSPSRTAAFALPLQPPPPRTADTARAGVADTAAAPRSYAHRRIHLLLRFKRADAAGNERARTDRGWAGSGGTRGRDGGVCFFSFFLPCARR